MRNFILLLFFALLTVSSSLAADICQMPGEAQKGRSPASSNPCDTAGELMRLNLNNAQFGKLCQQIVASDPACQKIQPAKRLSCSGKASNHILNSKNFGTKVLQCIKGFLWDSMVELGKFVWEIIKIAAGGAVNSISKFILDADYRNQVLNAPKKTGKLASAFLKSSGSYFLREMPKNMAKCLGNPMCALGTTLAKPVVNFVGQAVEAMMKELVPQYQCMNGPAKLNTICRLAGELVMPPVFLISFLKHGIYGVKFLAKSRTAARFNVRFAQMNEMRTMRNVRKTAAKQAKTQKKVVKRTTRLEKSQARNNIIDKVRTRGHEKRKGKAVGKNDTATARLERAKRADQAAFLQTEKAKKHLDELRGKAQAADSRTKGNIAAANDNELSDIARYEKARTEALNRTQLEKARAVLAAMTNKTKAAGAATANAVKKAPGAVTSAVRNTPAATLNAVKNTPAALRRAPRVTLNAMTGTGKFVFKELGPRPPVTMFSSQLPDPPPEKSDEEEMAELDPLAGLSEEEIEALAAEYDASAGEEELLTTEGVAEDYSGFLDVGSYAGGGESYVPDDYGEAEAGEVVDAAEEAYTEETAEASSEEVYEDSPELVATDKAPVRRQASAGPERAPPPAPKYHGFRYSEAAPEAQRAPAAGPMDHIHDPSMRRGFEAAIEQLMQEEYLNQYRDKLQQDTLNRMLQSNDSALQTAAREGRLDEGVMEAVIRSRMESRLGSSVGQRDKLLQLDLIFNVVAQASGKKPQEIQSFLDSEAGKRTWVNIFGEEE